MSKINTSKYFLKLPLLRCSRELLKLNTNLVLLKVLSVPGNGRQGRLTVQLTCLTGYDSAVLLMLNYIEIYKFGRIQPVKQEVSCTYSDTSPNKVSEFSLW